MFLLEKKCIKKNVWRHKKMSITRDKLTYPEAIRSYKVKNKKKPNISSKNTDIIENRTKKELEREKYEERLLKLNPLDRLEQEEVDLKLQNKVINCFIEVEFYGKQRFEDSYKNKKIVAYRIDKQGLTRVDVREV
jgi:hypothetical protein